MTLTLTACDGTSIEEGEEIKTKYVDSELHGADPVLGSGMIPIMLSDTGVATYAHDYDEWYNYTYKKWANAVILVDNPSNPNYKAGDTILESDIRGYFVWIPKYKYKLFNMGNYDNAETVPPKSQVQEIEIVFGTDTTGETSGECKTPMGSGLSQASDATKKCQLNDYMTHPAFLSIPSNGFWVGKFETGYNQNSNVKSPITDTSTWTKLFIDDSNNMNKTLPENIIVKPNVYIWRNSNIYNFFMSAYNFKRNLDSHMMKNTEWGAVVYLSHSKYGIMDDVRINNNSNFLTGYAADTKDATSSDTANKQWNTTTGYTASTTGNITGIYDMSGGSYEYMASYMDEYGVESSYNVNSGFTQEELNKYSKYLDKYSSESTITSFKYRILGDATGEMGPFINSSVNQSTWYDDCAGFVHDSHPWVHRGGGHPGGVIVGQFYFYIDNGNALNFEGARLILTPTK